MQKVTWEFELAYGENEWDKPHACLTSLCRISICGRHICKNGAAPLFIRSTERDSKSGVVSAYVGGKQWGFPRPLAVPARTSLLPYAEWHVA